MRLKLKIGVLSLTLLLFSLILYSCVDEPFIPPVNTPFSEIRVLNLSHNVTSFNVFIDGAQPIASLNGMTRPSTTDYFDVPSGERQFVIINSETGDTLLNKEIEISSYERMQILFAGEWLLDPLQSTFAAIRVFEGFLYVDHLPDPGRSVISIIHASAPYDTIAEKSFPKITAITPMGDTTFVDVANFPQHEALEYEGVLVIDSALAGPYNFTFATNSSATAFTVSYAAEFTSDKYGYIYLYGKPDAMEFFSYEINPPPARQKN